MRTHIKLRTAALTLALLLFVAALFSSLMLISGHGHVCSGECCAVCRAVGTLNRLMAPSRRVAPEYTGERRFTRCKALRPAVGQTPALLDIKLNN